MRRATITEAKNGLSFLIDRVRGGETVVLTDRGVPVAVIEPVTKLADATGRLARLERTGVIRASDAPPPLDLLATPGPTPLDGASAVDALLDERRTER